MADYLQEDGSSKFVLEDGSGDLALEDGGTSFAVTITDTGVTVADSLHTTIKLTDQGFGGFASGPLSDNFNRANENPLSDGGQWTRVASGSNRPLQLASNQAASTGTDNGFGSTMVFSGAGVFADCDVWVTLTTAPTPGNYAGVLARQSPSVSTGQQTYRLVAAGNGFVDLEYINLGGGETALASWAMSVSPGDSLGLRCLGNVLTAYYRPAGGDWTVLGSATDNHLASGYAGLVVSTSPSTLDNFAVTVPAGTDSLRKAAFKPLTDTGLNLTDAGIVFAIRDTGLSLTSSLVKHVTRPLTDAGLPRLTDSLGNLRLTDTALTLSDSITRRRVVPRSPTDTGLTVTDLTRKTASKKLVDSGLTILSTLVASKNGHGASVNLTDNGATITSSLAAARAFFRAVPIFAPDVGLHLIDGIVILVNGGPPNSCTTDFRRFLLDLEASPEYATWCAANTPGDCDTWTTYANAILAGGTPSPPAMSTDLGLALVDAGIIALDGIVPCRAKPPPSTAPHAAFSFAVSGLAVTFTNESTPGPSGTYDSWLWTFGDGTTDTIDWSPSYLYPGAGTYVVTLTVVGSNGDGISSVSHRVTVFVPSTSGLHLDAVIV